MITSQTIKEKYAGMPDSELLSFAKEEGHKLTPDGHKLLESELTRRNLQKDTDAIERPEADLQITNASSQLWAYTFEWKEQEMSDGEIKYRLLEYGADETLADSMVRSLESFAKQKLKKAESERLTGTLMFFSGIAVTFLPISIATHRLAFIIAWCVIIGGVLQAIKGFYYQARFKKILSNIIKEKITET